MGLNFMVKGKQKLRLQLSKYKKQLNKGAVKGMIAAAEHFKGEVIELLHSGGRTGRTYKRGDKTHTASAPGEAPATDTGELARSIQVRHEKQDDSVTVGPRERTKTVDGKKVIPHAKHLEFNMNRPFMKPTFLKNKEIFQKNDTKLV